MSYSSRTDENRALYGRIEKAFRDIGITSQVEMAKKLGLSNKQKVQDWKSGKSSARKYLLPISKLTGKPIEWFYEADGPDEDQTSENIVEFPRKEKEGSGRDHEFEAKLLKRLREKLKTAPPDQRDFIHKVIKMLLGDAQDKAVD